MLTKLRYTVGMLQPSASVALQHVMHFDVALPSPSVENCCDFAQSSELGPTAGADVHLGEVSSGREGRGRSHHCQEERCAEHASLTTFSEVCLGRTFIVEKRDGPRQTSKASLVAVGPACELGRLNACQLCEPTVTGASDLQD